MSLSYFLLFTKSGKPESWFSTPTPTASAHGRTEEHLDGRFRRALGNDCGGSRVGLQGSFQSPTVAKSRTVRCSAGENSLPKNSSPPRGTHPMGMQDPGAMELLEHEEKPLGHLLLNQSCPWCAQRQPMGGQLPGSVPLSPTPGSVTAQ